jgi:hypothetical protein
VAAECVDNFSANVRSVGASPTAECVVVDVRSAQAKREIFSSLLRRAEKIFFSLARRFKQGG